MIAWWGWLVVWVALGLALLAVLALSAWRLFRKFLTLLDDLSDLTDQLDVLDDADHDAALPASNLAVLADARSIRARESDRVERQRQRRKDGHSRRMSRALEIGSVDVTRTRWPAAWYRRGRARTADR